MGVFGFGVGLPLEASGSVRFAASVGRRSAHGTPDSAFGLGWGAAAALRLSAFHRQLRLIRFVRWLADSPPLLQVGGVIVTLEIPDSGSIEELSVVVNDGSPRGDLRCGATAFPGVVYLVWWVADLADWGIEDEPAKRPVLRILCKGGDDAAVAWFVRLFLENGGAVVGARELFEETGLIERPELLVWLL